MRGGETMSSNEAEIRKQLDVAVSNLKKVEGQYGSDPKHPRVGQYYAEVQRLERELKAAGG